MPLKKWYFCTSNAVMFTEVFGRSVRQAEFCPFARRQLLWSAVFSIPLLPSNVLGIIHSVALIKIWGGYEVRRDGHI